MAGFKEGHDPKGLDQILTELGILDPNSSDYRKKRFLLLGELLSNHRPELEAMLTDIDKKIGEITKGIDHPSEPRNPEHTLENLNLHLKEYSMLEEILNLGTEPEEEESGDDKPTIH